MAESAKPIGRIRTISAETEIDRAIGAKLKDQLSDVLTEPMPPVLLLAASDLTMPAQVTVVGRFLTSAANPWTAIFIPLAVTSVLLLIYIVKSLIGVDLFEGHSFLHQLFFEWAPD